EAVLQGDEGLDDLHRDRVRLADNPRFGDGGMLDQDAFDLEGADEMAGRIDYVVGPADEPEVAFLILTGPVTGDVPAVAEVAAIHLFVLPVCPEHRGPARPEGKVAFLAGR